MFKVILFFILSANCFAFESIEKTLVETSKLKFTTVKGYSENQILDFQESVVDRLYKKLIEDEKYILKTDSNEFKQYVRAIGFLSMHSEDHNAASYIPEITQKLIITPKTFWKKVEGILPSTVINKLKADYKIEVRPPGY